MIETKLSATLADNALIPDSHNILVRQTLSQTGHVFYVMFAIRGAFMVS